MAKKNEVVKEEEPQLPVVFDYGAEMGAGFENVTQADFSIPFISVLQSNSPQVSDRTMKHLGAGAGDFFNTVTEEVFNGEEGIVIIPCWTNHHFVEWVPRTEGASGGGGFVGIHELDSPVVTAARQNVGADRKLRTAVGNDLVETYYIAGILLGGKNAGPEGTPVMFPLAKTKIKAYKNAMSMLRQFLVTGSDGSRRNPPLFANRLRITTKQESRKNNLFYNIEIAPDGPDIKSALVSPQSPEFAAARAFWKTLTENQARVNYAGAANEGEATGDEPPF